MLHEVDGEMAEVRQIESVEPDHGAGAVLAVVVPVHGRCEDHVAAAHLDAAAVDGREAPFALDDEAHGERDVSVRGGGLVGHDELETGVDGVGGVGRGCESGERHHVGKKLSKGSRLGERVQLHRAGLTSISTLLSACFSVIISPALRRCGLISS